MTLEQFAAHIRTLDGATLDGLFDEITAKLGRARSPSIRAGYALALDELVIEANLRHYAPDEETQGLTDGELLAALGVSA